MKKSISRRLNKTDDSTYIPVKIDGRDVIRISGHLPTAANLRAGKDTKNCKNIFLIFVRNRIVSQIWGEDRTLAKLLRLIDSDDPAEKKCGEIDLNNILVCIGKEAGKGINYKIIDGNSDYEVKETVKAVTRTLKTSVFVPLKYRQD
jgi:hypothetical protein